MPRVTLKAGREKSLRLRHPWIFSGAIEHVDGAPDSGATVTVQSADGEFVATAAWSAASQIRARVWSFDARETVDAAFIAGRVRRAVRMRDSLLDDRHTGCRLVHGESDGLPGVIADRYGDVLVVQFLAAGAEAWRDALVAALREATGGAAVYERSDADVRALEGLQPRVGLIAGVLPERSTLIEDGLAYRVDVAHGQKTGFYLDQRDNRRRVRELAHGRDVLNCFCYTGGFSIAALAGNARSVLSVDSSAEALLLAGAHVTDNKLDAARAQWRDADVFAELRKLRDGAREFDLIVLDPPKFAPTAHHAEKATRAYKDINLLALKLLRPGGLLATFSCSGGVSAELFQKIVAGAALDARADAAIVARFGPSADHPVALNFPEGDYLKGVLIHKRA
ncbi:MAG: class I SAM-dependent methyltransferase [Casimicrobiaceae bacterium]